MSARHDAKVSDLLAMDHLAECPACNDLNHPTLSRCEHCGAYLYPQTTTARPRCLVTENAAGRERTTMPANCSCDGQGICIPCVFFEYENDSRMIATALAATEKALARTPADLKPVT